MEINLAKPIGEGMLFDKFKNNQNAFEDCPPRYTLLNPRTAIISKRFLASVVYFRTLRSLSAS
jgi:hypothetical protein